MSVMCDVADCKYIMDDYCGKDNIKLKMFECQDFALEGEEATYTDKFYKRNKNMYVNSGYPKWVESRGKKITVLGRECFARYDLVTDGRTGGILCDIGSIPLMEKEPDKYLPKILNCEKEGISPLYGGEL